MQYLYTIWHIVVSPKKKEKKRNMNKEQRRKKIDHEACKRLSEAWLRIWDTPEVRKATNRERKKRR